MDYKQSVQDYLTSLDSDTLKAISAKKVRKHLEQTFNVDLTERKAEIDEMILQCWTALQSEEEEEVKQEVKQEVKHVKKEKESTPSASSMSEVEDGPKRGRGGGWQKMLKISPELSTVMNDPMTQEWLLREKDVPIAEITHASRPTIVQYLWGYIKSHDLQDPSDKRSIICDDVFKKVMNGNSKVTGFNMNKEIGKHVQDDASFVNPNPPPPSSSRKRKTVEKTPSKPKRSTGGGTMGGWSKELKLSEPLKILINDPSTKEYLRIEKGEEVPDDEITHLSRPKVVKFIWGYVKSHNLQDPNDGRQLICDDVLKAIFGKKKVSAFGMNRDIGRHLGDGTEGGSGSGRKRKVVASSSDEVDSESEESEEEESEEEESEEEESEEKESDEEEEEAPPPKKRVKKAKSESESVKEEAVKKESSPEPTPVKKEPTPEPIPVKEPSPVPMEDIKHVQDSATIKEVITEVEVDTQGLIETKTKEIEQEIPGGI